MTHYFGQMEDLMRHVFIYIMVLVLGFTLVACSNGGDENGADEKPVVGVVAAEVSDGDLLICDLPEKDKADFTCSWEFGSELGDDGTILENNSYNERKYTIDVIDQIPEQDANQTAAAALLLEMILPSSDFDVVFEIADEGTFHVWDLDIDGEEYDWVQFYAGDTEVGMVFKDNSIIPIGEISDGDIKGCQ
jgi:hypothetical protein